MITIGVLAHNELGLTKNFINSVFENTNGDYELIVVNNGSTDGTKEYLDSLNCIVINNKNNETLSRGFNKIINVAKGDYIAICNNDILLPKDWDLYLVNILRYFEDIYMITPDVTDNINTFNENKNIEPITEIIWDYFLACCMFFRKECFKEIGLFDENFKLGTWEDIDIKYRIYQIGKKVAYLKGLIMWHQAGSTIKKYITPQIADYNRNYFAKKYNLNLNGDLICANGYVTVNGKKII